MQTQIKVKGLNNLTIPKDLSIPDFLLRVQTDKEKQESRERQLQLRVSDTRPSLPPPVQKPKDPLVEQFRTEEEERRRLKTQNRITKMLERKQVKELPPGSRWDTSRCKWVVDNLACKPTLKVKLASPRLIADAPKKPGLISTIIELISRPSGASVDEILKATAERFPGRKTKLNTVRYYAKLRAGSVREDKKRGPVFYIGK
jgi:hypothetical protein